jgi:hypothetical protein
LASSCRSSFSASPIIGLILADLVVRRKELLGMGALAAVVVALVAVVTMLPDRGDAGCSTG